MMQSTKASKKSDSNEVDELDNSKQSNITYFSQILNIILHVKPNELNNDIDKTLLYGYK